MKVDEKAARELQYDNLQHLLKALDLDDNDIKDAVIPADDDDCLLEIAELPKNAVLVTKTAFALVGYPTRVFSTRFQCFQCENGDLYMNEDDYEEYFC
ncbi:MAG: hypothetical protein ACRDFB_01535 [Rhabdochlamydiaceae bacterium]